MAFTNPAVDYTDHFREVGALWEMNPEMSGPHAVTALGGKHTDVYFNSDLITSDNADLDSIVRNVLGVEAANRNLRPDWVFSYAPYGILLAAACSRALGSKVGYCRPDQDYQTTFPIHEGQSALVVGDDVHRGTSLVETASQLESRGIRVAPMFFTLVNLSDTKELAGRELVAAAQVPTLGHPADDCPMCLAGSRPLEARTNWQELIDSQQV
jgi:orotate phosphoribosyltransferase